jgi:hypothetical protein
MSLHRGGHGFNFADAASASVSEARGAAFRVKAFKLGARLGLYRQSPPAVHEVLIAIYEAVTERALGRTYALQAYPEYRAFFLAYAAAFISA